MSSQPLMISPPSGDPSYSPLVSPSSLNYHFPRRGLDSPLLPQRIVKELQLDCRENQRKQSNTTSSSSTSTSSSSTSAHSAPADLGLSSLPLSPRSPISPHTCNSIASPDFHSYPPFPSFTSPIHPLRTTTSNTNDTTVSNLFSPSEILSHQRKHNGYDSLSQLRAVRRAKRMLKCRAFLSEILGTFLLMFVPGVIAVARWYLPSSADDPTLLSFTFLMTNSFVNAITLVFLIYTFESSSGALMNPIVTLAFYLNHKIDYKKLIVYVVAQLIGGLLAMLAIFLTFGCDAAAINAMIMKPATLKKKYDSSNNQELFDIPLYSVFFIECIGTFVLIIVVFLTSKETEEQGPRILRIDHPLPNPNSPSSPFRFAYPRAISQTTKATTYLRIQFSPLAIGFTLGALVAMSTTTSGGAFNPIRYLSPAIASGFTQAAGTENYEVSGDSYWENSWAWLTGELCGCLLGTAVYRLMVYLKHTGEEASIQEELLEQFILPPE